SGAAAQVPPEAIKAIPLRHYGRWVSGALVLAVLVLLIYSFAGAKINYSIIPDYLFAGRVVAGVGKTLLIHGLSMVIGVALGIVLAVMKLSRNPVTSAFANAYIWFFRGTPVLLQLLLWFNLALVFPILDLGFYKDEVIDVMTPFMAALLGLALNE